MITVCKKRAYRDLDDAHAALNCLKRESDRLQVPQRVYHCEECGLFHLTKYSKQVYRSRAGNETDLMGEVKKRLKELNVI